MTRINKAFTLIELLVVVSIIVVLIALLLPAMEKAIYVTELTTCGARQRGNTATFTAYAMDFKRYYPKPAGGRVNNSFDALGPRVGNARNPLELMPLLEPRMSLKSLLCPLLGGISYDPKDNNDLTIFFSNYYLFFSTRYTDVPGNKGLYKIGDGWEHRDAANVAPDAFGVILMDLNAADTGNTYAMTGHPDDVGSLPKRPFQNVLNTAAQYVTFSRWQSGTITTGEFRGKVDLNFAYEDGSVRRMDRLKRDPSLEDRTQELPYYPSGGSPAIKIYVPSGR